ncbi:MAG: methyltransferase domain-containing protein [Deltaproteobacteria bacterium]|nr:MAG: methyltransferase domain-containing protein [Deltaproteobacteria bacterium]
MHRRELLLSALSSAFLAACGRAVEVPSAGVVGDPGSHFHRIYGDDALRAAFKDFLVHVFHLYPEDKFHDLIHKCTLEHASDEAIYAALVAGLPTITPIGSTVTYALPALKKQKQEMAAQVAKLLGEGATIDGYVEMGTTGRYLKSLDQRVSVEGPVYVLNDLAPTNSPVDLVERGQLSKVGSFVHLGEYEPVSADIPDASVDLVSNLIGFHHCPEAALGDFVASLRRVLRPGGRLLVREHDVVDETMDTFVALAHDVFNAGVGVSWADNQAQIRHFRSVAGWTEWIEAQGFTRVPEVALQEGDPTDNALLCFTRV